MGVAYDMLLTSFKRRRVRAAYLKNYCAPHRHCSKCSCSSARATGAPVLLLPSFAAAAAAAAAADAAVYDDADDDDVYLLMSAANASQL